METNEKRLPDLVNLLKSWITWRTEPTCVSRAFWMPDDSCMVCYECDSQFTIFNRRHHCRKCGRVFCARCTSNFIPVNSYDSEYLREEGEFIRVCNFCFQPLENVAAPRNEARPSSPILSPSLSTTSLASTKSSAAGNSSISTAVSFAYSAGAFQQTSYATAPSSCQSIQLETPSEKQEMLIVETNMDSLADKGDGYPTHFGFCLNRSDDDDDDFGTCQWDSEEQRYNNSDEFYGPLRFDESERVYGPDKLHHTEGNIDIQDNGPPDPDNTKFHTPLVFNKTEDQVIVNNIECEASCSLYSLNTTDAEPMDFENNQQLWFPPEPEDEEDDREGVIFDDDDDDDATGEWRYMRSFNSFGSGEHRSKDRSSEEQKKAMKNIVDGHFRALVSQLLQVENIPICEEDGKENWLDIITSLSWKAATLLKPDTSSGGGMDPGLYVKVKCLACGRRSDSTVLKGVVCKKNVAHRRMPSKIEKPRLLLLGGALEYQRVSNLLSSFDTLLQQEMDHLKMAVAKIDAHHPNLLLVEKSVSRYAQEYLLAKNISLVLNMKRPLLERIARCTGAEIIPSIDHLSSPKLGHCDVFHVEKFLEEHGYAGQGGRKVLKTLMFFEGCPKPLGCTILLKGSSCDELKKVKHVIQYGVFAAYHLALETSFLADEGASFPELPLKSPITVALPDKPLSINQSISTIPGFILPSAETSQSNSDVQTSSKSDPNVDLGNHIETGFLASAFSSGNHAFKSVSTSVSAPMRDLPVEKGKNTSNIDGEQNRGPLIPLSHSGKVPSSLFGVTSSHAEGENRVCLLKEDETKNMENDSEVNVHHPVPSSSCLDKIKTFEGGGSLDSDMQADDAKMKEMQNDLPSLVTSHQNSPMNDQLITKEEFPPSPPDHQSILVSLSSRCVWKGTVCERSHLLRIKYYGSFDKPLGRYLRDHLFDQSYRCRSCEMPSEAHIYCYTHRQGSLTISVRKLQDHLPGERDGKIWMWHRCLRCPRVNGLPPAIRRVVMSDAAWGLSLGKFLELSFSNHAAASRVASCGHSLHRDCLRFYGSGEMVACFKYAPINVHSVYLPPSKLDFNYQDQEWVQEEVYKVSSTVHELFSQVQKSLQLLEEKASKNGSHDGNMKVPESRRNFTELEGTLRKEQSEFEESLQTLTKREELNMQLSVDILEVNKLQKQLLLQAYVWDKRLVIFAASASSNPRDLPNGLTRNKEDLTHRLLRSFTNSDTNVSAASELINVTGTKDGHDQHKQPTANHQRLDADHDKDSKALSTSGSSDQFDSLESESDMLSDGQFPNMTDLSDTLDAKWRGENGPALVDASILKSIDEAASSVPASEICEESSRMSFNSNFASGIRAKSGEFAEDISILINKPFSELYACLMKTCDSALFEYHPQYILLFKELIQKGWGRLLLPPGINDTVVPIYDEEPTSAISYALACPDYHLQISDELEKSRDNRESSMHLSMQESGNSSIFQSLEDISFESFRSFGSFDDSVSSISSIKNSVISDPLLSTKSQHVRVSFAQRYNVTCYYAKHFDTLRKNCCPSELDFIRSLSRCKKWGAQGGKSNVFFAKSLDDRFIIKQVTKTELESFIKFAPEYFRYLLESIRTGSPTCLAKILGIYQVSIKSLKGGKETKMDVLVMENLLFRRNVKWLYDLKGSARSRYNADSSGTNKVLLDQNLIEAMPTSPIFVGNKAKRLLERAVWNDTAFLASIDVMDYSLLVGVDENNQELVLGIIDFMRQYTWDKHLETWVKTTGILGGPKDAPPTVISPKQYKKRFRKAMSAYFLVVPDQWSPASIIPSRSQSDLGEDSNHNNFNNNNNLQGGFLNW